MKDKCFHIVLSVKSIAQSVEDYTQRLGQAPDIIVENEYALWRSDAVNFSIRQVGQGESCNTLRHIGFEDEDAQEMSESTDCNGIVWEHFAASHQDKEIKDLWG